MTHDDPIFQLIITLVVGSMAVGIVIVLVRVFVKAWGEQKADEERVARIQRREQHEWEHHHHRFMKKKSRIERKLDKGIPYHLGADGEIVFDSNERAELEEDRGK